MFGAKIIIINILAPRSSQQRSSQPFAMKIFAVFAVFAVGASARVLLDDSCATADCCNEKISISGGLNWESEKWCKYNMPCRDVAWTLLGWGRRLKPNAVS